MTIKKVTAIIDSLQLDPVEEALLSHEVTGFTVTQVKGRGHYYNSYSQDKLIDHYQIDIYTDSQYAVKIARLIMQIADIKTDAEGLVAITAVDDLFWFKKQSLAQASDFNFAEPE